MKYKYSHDNFYIVMQKMKMTSSTYVMCWAGAGGGEGGRSGTKYLELDNLTDNA